MKSKILARLVMSLICAGMPLVALAQNSGTYDPEVFALESGRGKLAEVYFGVRLADVEKDARGRYVLTEQQRETIKQHILGRHMCSLQWISWKNFGSVTFSEDKQGNIVCKGGQKSTENDDYLKIDGTVTIVSPLHIRLTGTIVTKVDGIAGGEPVTRKGTFNFTIAGARHYWRMREMSNPADECADYVDIYF